MNKSTSFFFSILLFLFISFPSVAQKNRAIIQDAGGLLKILNRDYYSIEDPEIRLSEIQKDRATVVSIFKAYTANDFTNPTIYDQNSITEEQWKVKKIRQKISTWSVAPQNSAPDLLSKQGNIDRLNTQLITGLEDLETKLYKRDTDMLDLLSNYYQAGTGQNASLKQMVDLFKNKFKNISTGSYDSSAANIEMPQLKKSLGLFTTGGLTFTQVIDGLATFMAKRIKQELAAQIFDKIKRELSETDPIHDKFLELKILLPSTTNLLQTIAPEQYQGMINSLKESIEIDLNNLMVNIPGLINSKKVKKLIDQHPEIELAFLGLQLIQDLNKVKSPTEIIFVLETSEIVTRWSTKDKHKNFVNGIRFASLITYALTEDASDTRHFIKPDTWVSLYKTPDFYNLFIGFLIQQDKKYYNITFGDGSKLNDLLKGSTRVENWYNSFTPQIIDLLEQASGIESQLNELKKKKSEGDKPSVDSVAEMLKSSISFLDSAISLTDIALEELGKPGYVRVKSRLYFTFAREAVEIYSDLGSKRYYNAISKAVGLTGLLDKEVITQKADQIKLIINKVEEVDALHLDLSKEISSARITSITLERLKALSTNLKSVCSGCTDFDAVLALSGDLTTPTDIAKVSTLKAFLKNTLTIPFFVAYYNKLFLDILQTNGLEVFPLPVPTPAPVTLSGYRDFLYSNLPLFTQRVIQNPEVLKVINFLVAVSKAEDAEALTTAIEAIALPPGSAIIKRESALNISLNGYAGFYSGVERIYEINSNAGAVAFTVPVGVAISKSFGEPCEGTTTTCKRSGSWSLFLSAIDIGAFTSVRFKDGDEALPEIKFKNIFAPGIQLIYGIPKSSFSIAALAQLGPFLRKVKGPVSITTTNTSTTMVDPMDPNTTTVTSTITTESTAVLDERPAIRFGVSFLLDIPLINFYTKSKGYRR
ncbi:MAG: hypothetical protein AAF600_07260 [Bacteroidota bacterium]